LHLFCLIDDELTALVRATGPLRRHGRA
jgi:hypothetical protein